MYRDAHAFRKRSARTTDWRYEILSEAAIARVNFVERRVEVVNRHVTAGQRDSSSRKKRGRKVREGFADGNAIPKIKIRHRA